jgi:hypothetical protein
LLLAASLTANLVLAIAHYGQKSIVGTYEAGDRHNPDTLQYLSLARDGQVSLSDGNSAILSSGYAVWANGHLTLQPEGEMARDAVYDGQSTIYLELPEGGILAFHRTSNSVLMTGASAK